MNFEEFREFLSLRMSLLYRMPKKTSRKIVSSFDDNTLDYMLKETMDELVHKLHNTNIRNKNVPSLSSKYRFFKEKIPKSLLEKNFHVIEEMSDSDIIVYGRRFPVYTYGSGTILDCELRIYTPDNRIEVDCYEHNSKGWYAAFYSNEYGSASEILKIIENKIKKEFKKIGLARDLPKG